MNARPADVSVVIPVRDHASLLAEAIDSVLGQSSPPGEIVVVDDGSADGSAEVATAYGDPVRVLRQSAMGIAAARNAGIAAARGRLIGFLDADDRWTPDKLRLQLEALTDDVDMVTGWTAQVPQADWERAIREVPDRTTWRSGPVPGTLLVRRELLDRVGPYEVTLRAGESLDWHARAVHLGARVAVVPEVVLLRRIHPDNHGVRRPDAYVDYLTVARMAIERRRKGMAAE